MNLHSIAIYTTQFSVLTLPLFLVQISSGNLDAHIVQLNRENYKAPKLLSILEDDKIKKIFHYARADMGFLKNF